MTRPLLFTAVLALTISLPALAQEAKPEKDEHAGEITATVPALTDFHEVIFTIWHTAWPEKNVALLAELAPEVRRQGDILAKAQLPGILRDKEDAWRAGIEELQTILTDYEQASSLVDSIRLLDAAERLHARFEGLVRVIRPPLKEVDAFHQVLYMVYHHYLPGRDEDKLAAAVKEMKEKITVLDEAKLPERQKKREPAFIAARAKLSNAVKAMDARLIESDFDVFVAAVEAVHTAYQELEHVFE